VAQDVSYPQGAVRTRGGLLNVYGGGSPVPATAAINGLKTYLTPTLAQRLMVWDSLGDFFVENPQGTLNLINSRPYQNLFYESQTLFGREYQAFFNALGGFDIPRQYDDTNWDRVSQSGPGASPTAVDSGSAGNIVAGKHQVSVAFVTRQGFITQGAPPNSWTAAGSKQVALTNIPIGPANIVARLILFTPVITAPATTGSFYSLPTGTTQLATPTAMLINDNATVSATLDFTDTILIAGFSANYLFTQLELGEAAFAIGYNSRLIWLGERNKVPNFVNLSFDGGFSNTPNTNSAGPTSPSSAASLAPGDVAWANPNKVFAADGVLATATIASVTSSATKRPTAASGQNWINPSGIEGNSSFATYTLAFIATSRMIGTGFGFAIPATATILGVQVSFTGQSCGESRSDAPFVTLRYQNNFLGTQKQSGVNANCAGTAYNFGSAADLWGAALTPAIVNDPSFGVAPGFGANGTSSGGWVGFSNYQITITYTTSTQTLRASGYGFAIPANATVTGIKAQILSKATGSMNDAGGVFLRKAGAQVGNNHSNGNLWSAALTNQTYGGSADLWGTSWTPADINNAGFGVGVAVRGFGPTPQTASVDYISLTVFYTLPGVATASPLGWTQGATYAGGGPALGNSFTADWGDAFSITGDGATANRGLITQSAYQDYLLTPVIARNTSYRVRARVALAGPLLNGVLHINLQSTSGAFTTPGLAVHASQLSASYTEFDGLLTSALVSPPTDLLLQVYADGTPDNGGVFLVDSIEVYPTNAPFNYSTARCSRAFNAESYDGTTGQIQVRPSDGTQLRAGFPLRNNLYLAKDHYLCYVIDDAVNEPGSWAVNEVSATVGICGPNAVDWTEEWAVFAERSGLYICWGSDPVKITPEIQSDASNTGKISWQSINWQFAHTLWVRIDKVNKMILVGAPINGSTTPNIVFMMDYRWLEGAQDIANSPLITYSSFTGKILSHGRGRRWALWNITANAMTFAERSDGTAQPFFGNGAGNGAVYQQMEPSLQASDDGVAINSQYQGYGCPSHIEEQMYQLGAHRKLAGYWKFRAVGSGTLLLAISTTLRTTTLRSYTLSTTPAGDGERPLNVSGERFFLQVGTNAVGDWFQLEKSILSVKKSATIVTRGVSA